MSKKEKDDWVGDICYEEGSQIPFIQVPVDKNMPKRIFMYGYHHTGEFEPGPEGEEVPISEVDLYQFFSYNYAKEALDEETLDKVRVAFGLEPLVEAVSQGEKIIEKIDDKIKTRDKNLQ